LNMAGLMENSDMSPTNENSMKRSPNIIPETPEPFVLHKATDAVEMSGNPGQSSPIDDDARVAREIEESEALARMLMAEEAQASFAIQYDLLQHTSSDMNQVDLIAVQRLLRADEEADEVIDDEFIPGESEEEEEESSQPTYEDLLHLGDFIGDVRSERWSLRSAEVIQQLPVIIYRDESQSNFDSLCIFCQNDFQAGERIRTLPCNHAFHADCVDIWLREHDSCPTCKKCVCDDDGEGNRG